jgi:predicted nicotinamide N-methyase
MHQKPTTLHQQSTHHIMLTNLLCGRRIFLLLMLIPVCEGFASRLTKISFQTSTKFSKSSIKNIRWLDGLRRGYDTRCSCQHTVHGVECVEVPMEIPKVGRVVVLEATAEAQDVLVNLALDDIPSAKGGPQLNAGDPYGSVLWPAAYAVAAKIMEDSSYKSTLETMTVVELGTGTGLVSLALSRAGAKEVIATDYEEIPLRLLEYAAIHLNENCQIDCRLLDMKDYETPLPVADLVVAADIMYEPKTGIAMAKRALEALNAGARVIVGDSPGRPGRKAFLEELDRLGIVSAEFTDCVGYTCSGARHELICGKGSTSVSESPQEMKVAIMELDPTINLSK